MTANNRSNGHPVATGAKANPARLRVPGPSLGGMEGVEMLDSEKIRFIERVREAAREYGAVADLLSCVSDCVYVDDIQGVVTIGEQENIEWLRAVLIAAQFVDFDRSEQSNQHDVKEG